MSVNENEPAAARNWNPPFPFPHGGEAVPPTRGLLPLVHPRRVPYWNKPGSTTNFQHSNPIEG